MRIIRIAGHYHRSAEEIHMGEFSGSVDEGASPDIDPLEMSISASMARQYATDSRSFLKTIAVLLESVLPGEASIQRSGLFGGDKRPIRRIEITFTDDGGNSASKYTIDDPGHGPLSASRTQIVRNVALKSGSIAMPDLIEAISVAITKRAAESRATRDALKSLL